MADERPELTKTEMRQGNSRKMNTRVLIFGLIALIILFALVIWFSMATYDATSTTTGGGMAIEETSAPVEEPVANNGAEEAIPVGAGDYAAQ